MSLIEIPVVPCEQQRSQERRPCHVHQDVVLKKSSRVRASCTKQRLTCGALQFKYVTFQNYYCASIALSVQYASGSCPLQWFRTVK